MTLLMMSTAGIAATFTVTNTNDAGAGSLRAAIQSSNASVGVADVINFNIPGPGVKIISVLTGYPVITDQVFIDGWSQPGWTSTPMIEIDGSLTLFTFGLNIQANNCVVRGLAINNFPAGAGGNGVGIGVFANATGNWIYGCHIGMDASGMIARPNGQIGIWIGTGPTSTLIGTNGDGVNDALERNIISANLFGHGILVMGNNNTIAGNYIGTAIDGVTPMGNTSAGVYILNASGNTVGGTIAARRNVISSNGTHGIYITGATSTGNSILGNYIGTDATGLLDRGNVSDGIQLDGSASGTVIGGTAAGARNVVSGNNAVGIRFVSGNSSNTVQGNYVGTNATGNGSIPNTWGIYLFQSNGNTFGGTAAGAGNLISGNSLEGLTFLQSNSNVAQGNRIGTDVTGLVDLGNGRDGMLVEASSGSTIGGTTVAARNVISGNDRVGLWLRGSTTTGTMVQGNYIGTGVDGATDLGNTFDGIIVEGATSNTIGGTAAGAGNLISGNGGSGMYLVGATATLNTIQGNLVGTAANGLTALPNVWGLYFFQAPSNTIGGTASGAMNVISGNTLDGLSLVQSNNGLVQGNRIGTDVTGTVDVGNGRDGILVDNASNTAIGGTTTAARNLISGNNRNGILLSGLNTTATGVQGNYIGTNVNGTADLGNTLDGIFIQDAPLNTIGGTAAGAGNVLSGNNHDGISINGAGSTSNTIRGNMIGLNATGTAALGNSLAGVAYHSSATSNQLGGTTAASRNIISANGAQGVYTEGNTSSLSIQGNYIGTDITGALDMGNGSHGIQIQGSSTLVGGTAAGAGNVISGNGADGVNMAGATATGNGVYGNIIGLNAAGTTAIANGLSGVAFVGGASNNVTGGAPAGARNIISGNLVYGVYYESSTTSNSVQGNYIGTDITGMLDRGNGNSGVYLGGSGTLVGGTTAGAGNLLSGNNFDGVLVNGVAATGNIIQGNMMGLDVTGTAALGNSFAAIGLHGGASNNLIGGTASGARNILSGNGREGVWTEGSVSATTVQGNYIGTDFTGSVAIGNAYAGVELRGPNNQIGGTTPAARNVISGNGAAVAAAGVYLNGPASLGSAIEGNYIGTAANGTAAIPNASHGVRVLNASNNRIGGTSAASANVIAFNGTDGVTVINGINNAILGNSMFENSAEGIDLGDNGLTANDAGDPDAGANNLQNTPVVSALSLLPGGDMSITYMVSSSTTNSAYPLRIELFVSDGDREGKTFVVADNYTMPSSTRTFTFTPPMSLNAGDELVLTATDLNGNTSEFSEEAGVGPTITVDPADQTVCEGTPASFTVTATGSNHSFQWQRNGVDIPGAQSQTYTIASTQPTDAASYRVIVGSAANPLAFKDTSNAATLTVNTRPAIVTQPANVQVCEGEPTFIAVIANGTGLTYQWRKNGSNIPGANLGSYYIPTASAADAASYDVIISGTCAPPVTSASATLTVQKAPAITAQPVAQSVCTGQTATFSVTATGDGLTYQWRRNGINIGGAVGSTLLIPNAQPAQAGTYDVVVSGTCTPGVTSSPVALAVNAAPVITLQPVPTTTCQGVPATFTVTATGAGLTYQWRKNGVNIGGATSSTYTLASPQPADAGFYSVLVSGSCGMSIPSNTVQFIVNTAPNITIQPTSVTTCQGTPASFTVTALGTGPLNYQWRKNGINIAGATTQTYTIPSVVPADAGTYSVAISGVCAPVAISSNVTLTVNTPPNITVQPQNVIACQNTPATFTVTATGTGPFTYQWRKTGVPIVGATSQSYTIPSAQPADAGQYDVIVTGLCAPPMTSAIATLTVNAVPTITSVTPSGSACINTPFTFTVTAAGAGPLTYQWRKNGVIIPGATGTSYTIPSVQPSDAASYTVTVTGLCPSPATSTPTVLTVLMPPVITQQPTAINTRCEGQSVTFSVTATGAGLTYQWRKNGVPILGATSSSYTINSVTTLDAGLFSVVVGGTCQPTPMISANAQLVVNTLPRITASPLSQAICRTRPVTFSVDATGTGLTYQWRHNGAAITGATESSYTIPAVEVEDAGNYDVVVSGVCSPSVTSTVAVLTVNIEPVLFKWTESQMVQPGRPVTLSINATGTQLSYQWYKGRNPIPGATSSSYTIASVQTIDAGLYAVQVSNMCSLPSETSGGIFVFVGEGTGLAATPADQTVCSGSTARFVAPGDDRTFTYQWKKNGSVIPGASSSILTIPNASAADHAGYSVTVIDRETGMMLELRTAELTVVTGTQITSAPRNSVFCQGEPLRLEVAARGAGLRYQWRKNGIDIPGATSAVYQPGAADARFVGHYDVLVSGDCGNPVRSAPAEVAVTRPATITRQMSDTTIGADQQLTLSIEVAGDGLHYQWRKDGIEIAGATEPTLHIARVLPRDSGDYDVVVRGECGEAAVSLVAHVRVEGVSVVTGAPSIGEGVRLETLPHPAYGRTRVELTLAARAGVGEGTRVVLVDMYGREALDLSESYRRGGYRAAEFDAGVLASGVYGVRVESRGYSGTVGTLVVRK